MVWTSDVNMKNELLAVVIGVEARFCSGCSARCCFGAFRHAGFDDSCNGHIE